VGSTLGEVMSGPIATTTNIDFIGASLTFADR
jgi:hypothetical protein